MKTIKPEALKLDTAVNHQLEIQHQLYLEDSRKDAMHLAEQNRPELRGDKLYPYINKYKTRYEKLAADMLERIQPAANFPESKIDADLFKLKSEAIDKSIQENERLNHDDKYHLGDYNPKGILSRVILTIIITLIVYAGEAAFNTKAFLITGDNFLFALILSICLSFGVLVFAHISMNMVKSARNVFKRRLILAGTFLLATCVFVALAIFRSRYLEAHQISVEPKYFVIINLFFFTVACGVSYYFMPTSKQFKDNEEKRRIYRRIESRKNEIKSLQNEKAKIQETIAELTKMRIRIAYLAKYVLNKVQKMFREALAVFISTNLNFRKDGQCPTCFNDHVDDISIDIDNQSFTQLKLQSDEISN